MEIKVYDTEGKAIEDVAMIYKNAAGVSQTSPTPSNATGEISVQACHGQTLKDVTFSKDGYCNVKQDLEICESPSSFMKVVLRKSVSNEVLYEKNGVVPIERYKRVASFQDWGFGFKIKFDVTLLEEIEKDSELSILRVQSGGTESFLLPRIYLARGGDDESKTKLVIHNSGPNSVSDPSDEYDLTVGTDVDVLIHFEYNVYNKNGAYRRKVGGQDGTITITNKPAVYENIDLYLSECESESADGFVTVEDLSVVSSNPTSM